MFILTASKVENMIIGACWIIATIATPSELRR